MVTIQNYVRAKSLEEAYELNQKKGNCILGGMLWTKMQNRMIQTAIDLCDLGGYSRCAVPQSCNGWRKHLGTVWIL